MVLSNSLHWPNPNGAQREAVQASRMGRRHDGMALHWAVKRNTEDVVAVLLRAGASVTTRNMVRARHAAPPGGTPPVS